MKVIWSLFPENFPKKPAKSTCNLIFHYWRSATAVDGYDTIFTEKKVSSPIFAECVEILEKEKKGFLKELFLGGQMLAKSHMGVLITGVHLDFSY